MCTWKMHNFLLRCYAFYRAESSKALFQTLTDILLSGGFVLRSISADRYDTLGSHDDNNYSNQNRKEKTFQAYNLTF